MDRPYSYFVADVHLGLDVCNPKDREDRFVAFLRSIPSDRTENLFLLGDIWDFWYEYRDVVPKGYARVFASIQDLIAAGVKVWFFRGNHDIWSYHYFEELGMVPLEQPYLVELGGRTFCLGHGDGLGPVGFGYRFLNRAFKDPVLQALFSSLHPWFAFRFGNNWSRHSRLAHQDGENGYVFRMDEAPIVKFAEKYSAEHKVDCFIFGHYHVAVDETLSTGARFVILKDWIHQSPYFFFDATSGLSSALDGYSQNRE